MNYTLHIPILLAAKEHYPLQQFTHITSFHINLYPTWVGTLVSSYCKHTLHSVVHVSPPELHNM